MRTQEEQRNLPIPDTRPALVYIESQRDYAAILEQISAEPDMAAARFFVPNAAHCVAFLEAAREAGIEIEDRLLHYNTISPEHDEAIYTCALEAATLLYNLTLSCSGMIYGDRNRFVYPDTRWAFIAGLVDRFAGQMRPTLELETRIRCLDPSSIYLFPSPGSEAYTSLAAVQASAGGRPVILKMDHLPESVRQRIRQRATVPTRCRQWPVYDLASLELARRGNVLLMGNFKDRQYHYAMKPILPMLAKRHGLVLAEYIPGSPPGWLNDADIAQLKPAYLGRITSETVFQLTETDTLFVTSVVRRFRHALSMTTGLAARCAGLLALFTSRILFPLLLHARDTRTCALAVLRSCSAVVVVPGRTLEPNVFVGCAQALGIPTFEIQSGTNFPVTALHQASGRSYNGD
ncbi:hypothetical protein [Glycocaulis sp.]|uniref:hypothetical protein n=1 Tax=Glycocaulis sp. TaxID=1969725 RepID=UPI003D21B5DC